MEINSCSNSRAVGRLLFAFGNLLCRDSRQLCNRIRQPSSASLALRKFWFLALSGKDREAAEFLRACEAKGMVLPVERTP